MLKRKTKKTKVNSEGVTDPRLYKKIEEQMNNPNVTGEELGVSVRKYMTQDLNEVQQWNVSFITLEAMIILH